MTTLVGITHPRGVIVCQPFRYIKGVLGEEFIDNGVVIGIVLDNKDQDGFFRMKYDLDGLYKKGEKMSTELVEKDVTIELYREYDFGGRVYRIDNPVKLFYRNGGTTHRVVGKDNVVHCIPAPGINGCVLRWVNKDKSNPVEF